MTADGGQGQTHEAIRQGLEQCSTQFDIFRLLREIAELYQFKYFFIAGPCEGVARPFADMIIITSAPSDLVQRYDKAGLIDNSPLMQALSGIGAPFEYRLDQPNQASSPEQQASMDAFLRDYGLDCWFVTAVYHRDHGSAAVCFLGHRQAMDFTEAAGLALLSQLAQHRLRLVSANPAKVDSPLTERERECLVWTSAGKTSVEIARILGLSEHTVNHYLNNAARKLDAVNRTQAVAFAIRHGFID
jgi:LuxR family quorum sensing-dependent transcriptional regulator